MNLGFRVWWLLFGCVCLYLSQILVSWPNSKVQMIFCDVGQGDATLIQYGFTQLLIDGGKDDSVLKCLDRHMPFWDRNIEMLVVTHPDYDHYGGVEGVLDRYRVESVAISPTSKKSADYDRFKKVLQAKQSSGVYVFSPVSQQVVLKKGDLQVKVIWPIESLLQTEENHNNSSEPILWDKILAGNGAEWDPNDLSIALLLEYKKIKAFFAGDIEQKAELALSQQGLMVDVDILKVAHHGSKTSSTPELLQVLRPEISVVSAGKNNSYGHPDKNVLSRLEQSSVTEPYRTDLEGDIALESDGYLIWKK